MVFAGNMEVPAPPGITTADLMKIDDNLHSGHVHVSFPLHNVLDQRLTSHVYDNSQDSRTCAADYLQGTDCGAMHEGNVPMHACVPHSIKRVRHQLSSTS